MLKCLWIDLVNRISSERKVRKNVGTSQFEYSDGALGDVLRTLSGRPEPTSQGSHLNVELGRPLNVISGRPWDVRSGRLRDGQIGSLGDVLGTLEGDVLGTSWGPIFAGWVVSQLKFYTLSKIKYLNILQLQVTYLSLQEFFPLF